MVHGKCQWLNVDAMFFLCRNIQTLELMLLYIYISEGSILEILYLCPEFLKWPL